MLLNCHTFYSFCYGTLSVEEMLDEISSKGYRQFVVSDINNTSAVLDTVRLSAARGLKPVAGIDFRNGVKQCYVGIARDNEGFRELNGHLSKHLHADEKFGPAAPEFRHAYVVYPANVYEGWPLRENEFIGVSLKDLQRIAFLPARRHPEKLVVLQPLTFIHKRHHSAHRLLRAIDQNTLLSKLPAEEQATADEIIPHKNELLASYALYPSVVENTERLLDDCRIEFEYGKLANKNLKHYTDSVTEDAELLRMECMHGLQYRYGEPSPEVLQRVEKELQVITQMNFASYFLINWDIVRYAQRKNYYYVGRGSGANSMVAYLLRITDVDPIELDLYFERFINQFRSNAPDFDIDFSWTDRDDMTRYIFERFGHERTALLATYATFQHDAVIRELGKVFGLPAGEIDRLQATHTHGDADELGRLVLRYSSFIKGFPSHLSIHSSGILISEKPMTCYTATFMPPKGYPTTQFSMLEAEDIGLYKFDILSQRGLGKIKDALTIIEENRGAQIDIHDTRKFMQDEKVKQLLSVGKCIGCFYIESPAMRMLLAKLQADDYLRLVAASSIIRPGVSKSGMMREYILRYRDKAKREKARAEIPELYDLLEETYGVMVYQEDVIKVAHFFAGLSLAEADYLRRGMSWKFKQRNEFWRVKENFFRNCLAKGYAEKTITDTWNQIESFANYAFSKGHSASYAVESFQALYLKAYFPLEYMVATLNNGGGFYRTEFYVHEARMHGAEIVQPCVNNSGALCAIKGSVIYLGLGMISELEQNVINAIVNERERSGEFRSLYDFVKRVPVSVEQLRILVRANTFRFTGEHKRALMWEAHTLINPLKKNPHHTELFDVRPKEYRLPGLTSTWLDDAFDDIGLFGFSLCSPFKLLRDKLPSPLTAKDLRHHIGKTVEIAGYLVTVKNTGTSKGERMHFGTFLDTEGMWIDTVHFPPSAKAFPFRGPGCYLLKGKVVEEFDFTSIEVSEMYRLPMLNVDDVREEELAGR
ncbi:MAG TPA: DNA polymerase III subunit alpha [Bacteroidia bacterium]|nr:DNA polymerase III subunit alpha [Bacteroidia bacterium]